MLEKLGRQVTEAIVRGEFDWARGREARHSRSIVEVEKPSSSAVSPGVEPAEVVGALR